MEKLNLHDIYELAGVVRSLEEIIRLGVYNGPELALRFNDAKSRLSGLRAGEPIRLRNPDSVEKLLKNLDELDIVSLLKTQDIRELDSKDPLPLSYKVKTISFLAIELKTVLANELPTFHSYIIERRGVYSINALINSPKDVFSEKFGDRLKSLEGRPFEDFVEASRCLAFGFPTACGFHIMRSAEAVLRNWNMQVDTDAQFKTDWKRCIDGIRSKNNEQTNEERKHRVGSVLSILDQIRGMHRNPLMHPEVTLEESQAVVLFDIAKSAIHSILEQIIALEEPLPS